MNLPTVDLRTTLRRDDTPPSPDVVTTIRTASETWGVFYVTGHGIHDELIERVWSETHRFFALPRETKRALLRSKTNARGYYDRELTKNRRDRKEVFDYGRDDSALDGANRWPSVLPDFRDALETYFDVVERVAFEVLELLGHALGVAPDTLTRTFTPTHTSFARLNYYPLDDPLETPARTHTTPLGDQALHHHSDAGALTLLLQDDVGGLQVKHHDRWWDVAPRGDALVVNLGDMVQVWSNDRFPAALHRVRPMRHTPRYSIPFFFNPSPETVYAPLIGSPDEPPRYRPITWGEFRQARADGDYADYGHEIQIADFRIASDSAGPDPAG